MKYNDKVESYTNLDIFPPIIFKKSLYPGETHFDSSVFSDRTLLCQEFLLMLVITFWRLCDSHRNVPYSESIPSEWQETEDAFTRMRQIECIANFLGFLNLNINPRDPFKTSWISRHLKYITFMIRDKIL